MLMQQAIKVNFDGNYTILIKINIHERATTARLRLSTPFKRKKYAKRGEHA